MTSIKQVFLARYIYSFKVKELMCATGNENYKFIYYFVAI